MFKFNLHSKLKAYTLVEMILVMGIISILGYMLIPYTVQALKYNSARNTAADLSSLIFSYQQEAYLGKNAKTYGFSFGTSSYTFFVGSSLATAESSDVTTFTGNISITYLNVTSGGSQITFSSGSLKPSSAVTIQITDEFASYQINVNSEGFISTSKV